MRFLPKSEDDLARSVLLEPGTYPFEVMAASDELSKNGNEMIKLKLDVTGPDGQHGHVYDYLLEKLAFKLRHFCESTGLLSDYETGQLEAISCVGKRGMFILAIEESPGYSPKNTVRDYIVNKAEAEAPAPIAPKPTAAPPSSAPTAPATVPTTLDDDIPF